MAQITKTIIFPVPTVWMGQDQDDTNVGIETYTGPDKIFIDYYKEAAGVGGTFDQASNASRNIFQTWDADQPDYPSHFVPQDCVRVELDATKFPLHAAAIWGGIAPPNVIEIQAGPAADDNPFIMDPHSMCETYDMRSFYWDKTQNSGAGGWSTPKFSHVLNDGSDPYDTESDDGSFMSWECIRDERNRLLQACDNRIAADLPDGAYKTAWKNYRQKLRDLPNDWAGIGTATHLIAWPKDPDEQKDWEQYMKTDAAEHIGRPAGK